MLLHTVFWVRMGDLAEAKDAREAAGVRIDCRDTHGEQDQGLD